jgi:hypothetical protein
MWNIKFAKKQMLNTTFNNNEYLCKNYTLGTYTFSLEKSNW